MKWDAIVSPSRKHGALIHRTPRKLFQSTYCMQALGTCWKSVAQESGNRQRRDTRGQVRCRSCARTSNFSFSPLKQALTGKPEVLSLQQIKGSSNPWIQVALVVKKLLANAGDIRDTGLILGWENPLEEGVATHSSMLAWRIPGQRSLVGYSPQGHKEQDTTEVT